ncbi:putative methyltransferase PMT26 [Drosera capensis]
MAQAKYTRIDGRKSSSNFCSTATIIVFVALCLVGVWMLTSSSVSPVENSDLPVETQKSDAKDEVKDPSASSGKQFEDSTGDLPDDATNVGSKESSSQEETRNDNPPTEREDKTTEISGEGGKSDDWTDEEPGNEEKKKVEGNEDARINDEDAKTNADDAKTNDEDAKTNDEDAKTNGADAKASGASGQQELSTVNTKTDAVDSELVVGENPSDTSKQDKGDESSNEKKDDKEQTSSDALISAAQSELLNETSTQTGSWSTQAAESQNEKKAQAPSGSDEQGGHSWKLCGTTAGPDFIPCLDNVFAIRHLRTTKHYEHRERHCPEEPPTCLVPLPEGYRRPIEWPTSRERIWYNNVPHTKLVEIKGHQNWVKVSGEYLTFPGGGTQFKHGALHYIEFIENVSLSSSLSISHLYDQGLQMLQKHGIEFSWGKSSRVVLDVGCGVASFGGFLFEKDVLTMSFAPKDEHEAQVQFALERGIPAISAVMGTQRLPFPGIVFDVVHCARCRVPWHIEGGKLLLELNRVLRPGGYFVWSATPVYQKLQEDVEIWKAMSQLTKSMCWELIAKEKDRVNGVGVAVFRKPISNECYEQRSNSDPPMCEQSDDRNAVWYDFIQPNILTSEMNVPLQSCMHSIPGSDLERGSHWPDQWPARIGKPPYWMTSSQVGVYGKAAPEDFTSDYEHWKRVVSQSYLKGIGISWSSVRNVMDMRAIYGGFAAALRDLNIWVMNVVAIDSADTLPIIYERGLFGIYHDWCESFNTYPRSYDLLHADHLFSKIKSKCSFMGLVAETDRILRPEGKLIVRDKVEIITELESLLRSMKWEIRMTYSKDTEGLLCAQKTMWRPTETENLTYANA